LHARLKASKDYLDGLDWLDAARFSKKIVDTNMAYARRAPSKKAKKSGADSLNARLGLVIKSGKYSLGYKSTLKQMRGGKG
jgi:hypothetical protein